MVSTTDLSQKEVVNVLDGRRLGFISDIEINLEEGRIEALVLPGQAKFLGFFGKENEKVIPWSDVKKIGRDVILVQYDGPGIIEKNDDSEF
ncbi:sporulation protein, YlmC/YmxH family [Caldanaerobius fijiensis DSM 17918]|uniref:Sporulation protein, YlmC/YmxH family n=1 Tax=Caldanaerobius fijiensis DSM 17918 TaxID=1121256 RepID=A0A1M4T171_9THEO|nr:YlmC/YmxH family sporulation protein [Caldanaerobius fijiensis]SHE38228.1 sporulation protein, YlmC/YmxH family [Caldanaerobius fijiensis DSM 17918]